MVIVHKSRFVKHIQQVSNNDSALVKDTNRQMRYASLHYTIPRVDSGEQNSKEKAINPKTSGFDDVPDDEAWS